MSSNTHKDLMLNVDGFGPIAQAENVLIKPMTVFVGPSNTGKSYLAILLYAISRGLKEADNFVYWSRFDQQSEHFRMLIDGIRDMDYATTGPRPDSRRSGEELVQYDWRESPDEVLRVVSEMHSDWLEFATASISKSIESFFEVKQLNELAPCFKPPHNGTSFKLCLHGDHANWELVCNNGHLKMASAVLPYLLLPESVSWTLAVEDGARDTALNDFARYHLVQSMNASFGAQFHDLERATYFPAARSGIVASHRTLNRTLVASIFGTQPDREIVPHNRIVNDFLEHLLKIEPLGRNADENSRKLAEALEDYLVDGSIVAHPTEFGQPEFVYSRDDLRIPLTRSSSMVTELAPVILFLKNFLQVGDTLIIEEPESHLHPAAQQKVAAALALLVRNGFRVLITTHSHYMVEQISDFVAASNLSPEKRSELLRLGKALEGHDIYLEEQEVGVYGFDDSTDGTIVKNIPFDESFAYVPEDHNQALTEQFNRNVRIMRAQRNGHSANGHNTT